MIDKDKISRGPVEYEPPTADEYDHFFGRFTDKSGEVILSCGGMEKMEWGESFAGKTPSESDASLIAEAFNVFTETGMTPRELALVVKWAKEYIEADECYESAMDSRDPFAADRSIEMMHAAKAELKAALA